MTSRRQKWAKFPRAILVDEDQFEIGPSARWLRVVCLSSGLLEGGHSIGGEPADDSIGWLITERGRPYSVRTLAKITGLLAVDVELALGELLDLGILVRDDEDVLGYAGWRQTQETPSAERKRRQRALRAGDRVTDLGRDSHALVTASSQPVPTEGEEEGRGRGRGTNQHDAGPRGDGQAPQALPAGEAQPDLTWLDGPEPAPAPDEAQQVFDAWIAHRGALGLSTKRLQLTDKRRRAIAKRGAAAVLLGMARAREKLLRESEKAGRKPGDMDSAQYFRLTTLTVEENLERLAEHHPSLDERLPQPRDGPRFPAKKRRPPVAPCDFEDEGGEFV